MFDLLMRTNLLVNVAFFGDNSQNIKHLLIRINSSTCKGSVSTLSVSSSVPAIQENLFYNWVIWGDGVIFSYVTLKSESLIKSYRNLGIAFWQTPGWFHFFPLVWNHTWDLHTSPKQKLLQDDSRHADLSGTHSWWSSPLGTLISCWSN